MLRRAGRLAGGPNPPPLGGKMQRASNLMNSVSDVEYCLSDIVYKVFAAKYCSLYMICVVY
jgi:hypothetical protein